MFDFCSFWSPVLLPFGDPRDSQAQAKSIQKHPKRSSRRTNKVPESFLAAFRSQPRQVTRTFFTKTFFTTVEVIYSASNKDETGSGASGQVQELQERSRTIRSITRMIRSSSRTTFTGVLVGFSWVLGGFSVVLDPPTNHLIFPSFPLKVPYIGQ